MPHKPMARKGTADMGSCAGKKAEDGVVCATQEALVMNVSHTTGRSVPYPDWAAARLARMVSDHATLPPEPQIGRPIGIRRK